MGERDGSPPVTGSADGHDAYALRSRLEDVEARLDRKAQLLDAILERMVQGLMLVNGDLVVEVCNRRAIELLDLPPDLMARRPNFVEVLEYQWSTDEFSRTPEHLKAFVRAGGILVTPQRYERTRPDGRVIEVQSVPLDGGGVLRTYTDISERRLGEERVRHRAAHDGLTSLVNRETFIERLTESIATATSTGRGLAVHYLDLDRFKPINDRMGHGVGDRVLAVVASRLSGVARDTDVVARIGGDEFAILQTALDHDEQATGLANRLIQALDAPIEVDGLEVHVGVSVGIAFFPTHGATATALIANADAALYDAKSHGGHTCRVHGDGPTGVI